jgi:hypothetical protein
MTKLSLLLYAADAFSAIDTVFLFNGVICTIATVFLGIIIGCSWIEDELLHDERAIWLRKHTLKLIVISFSLCVGAFSVSALIPEKLTMYMIAGVEMANEFRQTDTAHELSNEMKSVLLDITEIIHDYAVKHSVQEAK